MSAQNSLLNGVQRYPGGVVRISEVMANRSDKKQSSASDTTTCSAESDQMQEVIQLLRQIIANVDNQSTPKQTKKPKRDNDERVALAVVAIARGASSYQEIANQLGVSRGTVSKNPGIRRAMESSIRDRRPSDNREAEDARWQR